MKRAVLLATLLLSAAGYVFLQTTTPAPKLATLMPSGALLYLEAPDFGRLLRDWDASKVKADWLESANYAVFSRSNLFTKLAEVYSQYGEAAGFLPDLKSIIEIAGTDSALALYEIRDVEFLYVSRMAEADLMKTPLWAVREKFEQRQAGGVSFYLRTDPASKRTVAFAFAKGYLLLATRDDLVAQSLELLAGGPNPSIASDRWYRDSTAAASNTGELRLVMNLEALVKSDVFSFLLGSAECLRRGAPILGWRCRCETEWQQHRGDQGIPASARCGGVNCHLRDGHQPAGPGSSRGRCVQSIACGRFLRGRRA